MMNTLVVSDLHIAACIKFPNDNCLTDGNILSFLEYHTNNRINNEPWMLIINGDAIDFMAATVYPPDNLDASLDDRLHGLGSTCEKTKIKLKTIMWYYRDFFSGLAMFVKNGNQIKMISGNHDLEFSFKELQDIFIDELFKLVDCDRERFVESIKFYPWFYYEPNILYVEHGHQYDEYCSTDYSLALMDKKTDIVPSVAHIGMRYFVNKMPHYDPLYAEQWGFIEYMKWAYNIGAKKSIYSLVHYFIMVYKTLVLWYKLRSTDKERKDINDAEFISYSSSNGISVENIKKLYYIRRLPVTRNIFGIASTYFIDRMFLILAAALGIIMFAIYLHSHWKITIPIVVIIIGYLLNRVFNKLRFDAPSSVKLREAAQKISKILPAQIITFGHSHLPEVSAFENGTTYVNTGSWTEDGRYTYGLITKDSYELKYWRE